MAITLFGYLHGPQPDARACYDLRHQFRDPHLRPELRYLTALDAPVREAVMATDGVLALVHAIAATVDAYLAGPRPRRAADRRTPLRGRPAPKC
ncbi:hypothetical protein [Streptomyces sp. NPDC059513]|uniref:RapZ C-terminal domain-containing protein n=1 Tax=unclassified Streptomyces TaxID=2593676 RepID=UPI0036821084